MWTLSTVIVKKILWNLKLQSQGFYKYNNVKNKLGLSWRSKIQTFDSKHKWLRKKCVPYISRYKQGHSSMWPKPGSIMSRKQLCLWFYG